MKTILVSLLLMVTTTNSYSQLGSQQTISTNAIGAYAVFAADLDGDGDLDVLSTSRSSTNDNKIAWYENLDGQGGYGSEQIISTDLEFALDLSAYDIDGDGDIDVVSASARDDKIVWYENLDGQGNFGLEQIITTAAENPQSIVVADLDGDGDMDVFSGSIGDNKVSYYKNLDGQGNFGPQQIISVNVERPISIYTADLDNDGDTDVLSASFDDNKIAWYENLDGQGSFGSQQTISTDAINAWSVFAADLDGDGDIDVLSASIGATNEDKVVWYENLDGQGSFGSEQIIGENLLDAIIVYAYDLDNDGDIDVVSAADDDNKIVWYENLDGQGSFGSEQIITESVDRPTDIYSADLDGDGDMDLLSSSYFDNRIAWYKNNYPMLSVNENTMLDFSIYPNPTNDFLNIESKIEISKVDIYNQLGQLVLSNSNQNKIDVSSLSQGFYYLKVQDENGNVGSDKILKK
jgi:hypothetical protein